MAYDSKREVVVLFGGWDGWFDGQTWEWNGEEWSHVAANGPSPRHRACMAFDEGRNVTVLYGGYDGHVDDETWEWDGQTWSKRAASGPNLLGGAMAYDSAGGTMILFGGVRGFLGPIVNETWSWDGEQWILLTASGPAPRSGCAMAFDAAREVTVMFGGGSIDGVGGNVIYGDTWTWNGIEWHLASEQGPTPRSHADMAFDASTRRVVLFGGSLPSGYYQNDETWEWDGDAWHQQSGPAPPARREHRLAYHRASDHLVLFGGTGHPFPSKTFSDTWVRTGGKWQVVDEGGPDYRQNAGFAYDSNRRVAIMFAGNFNLFGAETWEYDAGARDWSLKGTVGPSPRLATTMAFDSTRNVSVLFGGRADHNGTMLGDTWEWDGVTWQQRHPSNSPSPRSGHAMVFDDARGVVVLYGADGPEGPARDTWEWDGEDWTRRAIEGPVGRVSHAMAYDRKRGVTVLFGGNGSSGIRRETWEWNGTNWYLRAIDGPSARVGHAMVYDIAAQRTIMFGGEFVNDDLWAWDGMHWVRSVSNGPRPAPGQAMVFDSDRSVSVSFNQGETWELQFHVGPEVLLEDYYAVAEPGQPVYFGVAAVGSGHLKYQWRRNGTDLVDGPNISGSQTATVTVTPESINDEGHYDAFVTDDVCAQLSDAAWLNVLTSNGDINGDGQVTHLDVLIVINEWGDCGYGKCTADVTENGVVDIDDLLFVIARWST